MQYTNPIFRLNDVCRNDAIRICYYILSGGVNASAAKVQTQYYIAFLQNSPPPLFNRYKTILYYIYF